MLHADNGVPWAAIWPLCAMDHPNISFLETCRAPNVQRRCVRLDKAVRASFTQLAFALGANKVSATAAEHTARTKVEIVREVQLRRPRRLNARPIVHRFDHLSVPRCRHDVVKESVFPHRCSFLVLGSGRRVKLGDLVLRNLQVRKSALKGCWRL